MKKTTYVLMTVSALLLAIAVSWAEFVTNKEAEIAQVAPAAGAPAPTASQPVTAAPAAAEASVPTATPASPAIKPTAQEIQAKAFSSKAVGVGSPPPVKPQQGAPEDLREAMQTGEFLKKLSFPLTEAQMVEFARASIKVGKINSKWDVQIASAETDQMAIEYNNLAVEEIEHALKSIPGLTLEQYNELTRMTTADKEFNSIYQAYKQLVSEGAFGEVPKGGVIPARLGEKSTASTSSAAKYGTASAPVTSGVKANTSAGGSQALPDAANTAVTPPSTSAGPGTAPVPQGSTTPPYSPPATR